MEQPAAYQASEPLLVAAPEVLTWTAKAWALVKACFIGIFCSFAFLSLVAGTGAGEGILGRFKFNAGAIMLLPPLTAILLLPIGIAKVFYRNLLGLPRGWADVFTGGSVGGLVTVAIAMEPSIKSSLMPLCFLFGGIMGGLTFWRAQGFPEVTPGTARIIDRVYGLLRRVRDPRRGMGV